MSIQIEELNRITLQPSDVLLVRVDRNGMTNERFAENVRILKDGLKSIFPDNKIIVADRTVEMSVISGGSDEDHF